jgi:hypothetical protein
MFPALGILQYPSTWLQESLLLHTPHKMNAVITSKSRKIDAEFLFSEIVTNVPVQITSQVPESYSKTSLDEILKIIASE